MSAKSLMMKINFINYNGNKNQISELTKKISEIKKNVREAHQQTSNKNCNKKLLQFQLTKTMRKY